MKIYRSGRLAVAATMLGMAALGACTNRGYSEGKILYKVDPQGDCTPGCTIVVDTGRDMYSINVILVYSDSFPGGLNKGDRVIFPLYDNIDGSTNFKNSNKATIPASRIVKNHCLKTVAS